VTSTIVPFRRERTRGSESPHQGSSRVRRAPRAVGALSKRPLPPRDRLRPLTRLGAPTAEPEANAFALATINSHVARTDAKFLPIFYPPELISDGQDTRRWLEQAVLALHHVDRGSS
jgi:hypothetical protein